MHRIDALGKCSVEGCGNLGEVHKIINHKVYRRKYCSKHKRQHYGMPLSYNKPKLKAKDAFRKRGMCDKCMICGWEGPCDVHRKEPQGSYNMKNMMASCPNCHRLIHRGLLEIPQEIMDTDFSLKGYQSGVSPILSEPTYE